MLVYQVQARNQGRKSLCPLAAGTQRGRGDQAQAQTEAEAEKEEEAQAQTAAEALQVIRRVTNLLFMAVEFL